MSPKQLLSLKSLKSLARSSLRTDQESPGHPITRNSSQGSLGNDLLMAIQGCARCEGVRATEVREGWWWSTVLALGGVHTTSATVCTHAH